MHVIDQIVQSMALHLQNQLLQGAYEPLLSMTMHCCKAIQTDAPNRLRIALALTRPAVLVYIFICLPLLKHIERGAQRSPNRNAGGCQLGLLSVLYQVKISFCPSMETRNPATTGTAMEIACQKSRSQYMTDGLEKRYEALNVYHGRNPRDGCHVVAYGSKQ